MKIGLFFGSFNPVHAGHLIIANYMVLHTDLNRLWFMVSPQSPFKQAYHLADESARLEMVKRAIGENELLKASDFEFEMERPSYTIDTLNKLANLFPNDEFVLVLGSDNLTHFDRWKNYEEILDNYKIYIYLRPDSLEEPLLDHPNVSHVKAPLLDISSTYIRNEIANNKSCQYLVPESVYEYIKQLGLYSHHMD